MLEPTGVRRRTVLAGCGGLCVAALGGCTAYGPAGPVGAARPGTRPAGRARRAGERRWPPWPTSRSAVGSSSPIGTWWSPSRCPGRSRRSARPAPTRAARSARWPTARSTAPATAAASRWPTARSPPVRPPHRCPRRPSRCRTTRSCSASRERTKVLQKLGPVQPQAADVAARLAADWTVGLPTRRVPPRGSPAPARRRRAWLSSAPNHRDAPA